MSEGGGVLLLDEAYQYTQDQTCFDKEAINCIVKNMEDHREVMCIFAGYKEPMQEFVESNPGLRSRIGFVFEFSDYDADDMCLIADYQAKALGYSLPPNCSGMLTDYFAKLKRIQGDSWGNGREARKLIENCVLELAERLSAMRRKPKKSDVTAIGIQDLEAAIKHSLERESAFEKKSTRQIGFLRS